MDHVDNKRVTTAWTFFDWANSSYALVIAVAVFPIYFNAVVDDEGFTIFGISFTDSVLFSYSLTAAYLLIVLVLPLLGGLADASGRKMFFMRGFTWLGGLSCIAMFWFTGMDTLAIGIVCFILSTIGFAGGQVFNNAFLPIISSNERVNRLSARGFAMGYVGSVILLLANLMLIQNYESFGFTDEGIASRISFVMVGLWWIGFAHITFARLPVEPRQRITTNMLVKGYRELMDATQIVARKMSIKRFLFSFFFYSAGVQTVIFLASTFATDELQFETADLIMLILLLQIVAIAGAYLFARIATTYGNRQSILLMLVIWFLICGSAYFIHAKLPFYVLAVFVGLVMGGIQSISRSTFSKMIKGTTDTATYFSFYDVVEKLAVVIGTFSFGFVDQLSGSMRQSLLILSIYFVIGIILLLTMSSRQLDEPQISSAH